jgi:hypothetical protein
MEKGKLDQEGWLAQHYCVMLYTLILRMKHEILWKRREMDKSKSLTHYLN